MGKTKEPKAVAEGKGKSKGKGDKPAKVKKAKVKGALMDKATNLVLVLFVASLVAERVTGG
ncbi:MAG: hypothetical protein JWN17_7 [Frankiales bacterium]|nr:hypothetical protein [Frankiales bacterium]